MDLFNKKKINSLEQKNFSLKEDNERLKKCMDKLVEKESYVSYLEKESYVSYLEEENKKLIEWVQKILEVNGVYEVNEYEINQVFSIPIYKCNNAAYNCDINEYIRPPKEEEIYIPAIRIRKIS